MTSRIVQAILNEAQSRLCSGVTGYPEWEHMPEWVVWEHEQPWPEWDDSNDGDDDDDDDDN